MNTTSKLSIAALMTMQTEIGEWAQRNFAGKFGPALGIIEEIGEISHCLLKRRQGIRGFDDPEHFKKELGDALADCGVYALHSAYITGAKIEDVEFDAEEVLQGKDSDEAWMAGLSIIAAGICAGAAGADVSEIISENLYGVLFGTLEALADGHGINYEEMLAATWGRVKQRDWVKNPKNAHSVAESAAAEATGKNPDGSPFVAAPQDETAKQA